jgi:hypothetical protein
MYKVGDKVKILIGHKALIHATEYKALNLTHPILLEKTSHDSNNTSYIIDILSELKDKVGTITEIEEERVMLDGIKGKCGWWDFNEIELYEK